MTLRRKEKPTAPVDADVGDEVDVKETGQTISSHAIEAVVLSPEPVEERVAKLRQMRDELQARFATRRGHDLGPLVKEIDNALDRLGSAGGKAGTRTALRTGRSRGRMPTSINPATGQKLIDVPGHGDKEVDAALTASADAFRAWAAIGCKRRGAVLARCADLLEERCEGLARLATAEMGKRIAEARAEVEKCAWVCRYYVEHAATFLADDPRPVENGAAFVRYLPLGVVLAVMPWNFPYWQVFRCAVPALMAGNVCVLKHASNVPQCALEIEKLFREAGAPRGVFTSLLIPSDRVASLIDDERVSAVSLTGSGSAGSAVGARAGQNVKVSVLELGGSDPFIVMPSADLERAVETGVKARMINNGQSCIAAKRFIVHEQIHHRFLERFAQRVGSLTVGDPMDEDVELGPLATADILDTLAGQVEATVAAGARCVIGGRRMDGPGFFYQPTVVTEIAGESPARREEFFGPVALLFKAESAEHALALANDNPYGLASSVWTRDPDEQDLFISRLAAGSTFVNQMVASDPRLPFGGMKRSGYGRELSREGLLSFVNAKTVLVCPA